MDEEKVKKEIWGTLGNLNGIRYQTMSLSKYLIYCDNGSVVMWENVLLLGKNEIFSVKNAS